MTKMRDFDRFFCKIANKPFWDLATVFITFLVIFVTNVRGATVSCTGANILQNQSVFRLILPGIGRQNFRNVS
jgi:hypothetical protein